MISRPVPRARLPVPRARGWMVGRAPEKKERWQANEGQNFVSLA
jgi:hypothetical protein